MKSAESEVTEVTISVTSYIKTLAAPDISAEEQ